MTFEELKQKLDTLKTKRDQCLGVIKNIEDGWEEKYGTRDVHALREKFEKMETELKEITEDFNSKMKEAEEILNGK
ncbi:MAG TPA: hypothetical protein VJ861_11420 [Treponemataceae bacterium]|jgi:predicted  nucleic acid-binding Zn-ribbon protein|nr:hypothetical protein [Treponemataceae bacterium]